MKNIIIAVSGTGGHVYPGIALAFELKQSGYEPIFIVNKNSNHVSVDIINFSNYKYEILDFSAPPRNLSLNLILFPFLFIKNIFAAVKIIKKTNPKAVIGMGAYLSVPVILAAKFKNIPSLIHEQNYFPGLANRILSKFADKIAVSFNESAKYFNKTKTVFTSNPVRKDIFNISRKQACATLNMDNNIFTVFVFGGSLGASKINSTAFNAAEKLYSKYGNKIQFIHITGKKDFENIKRKYENIKFKKHICAYMNDIGNAYACSDLLICRAGAGTVKEVQMYGLKALFIPYPYAASNHQFFNAKTVEEKGLREIVEEKDLTKDSVINFIEKNINQAIDSKRMISPAVFPQEKLAQEVIKLIK